MTATQYALDVTSGREIAGPLVRAACQRHLNDLASPPDGCWFDGQREEFVAGFFSKHLRLFKGEYEGQPFNLFPWARFVVGSIFGWKRSDGTRRFRTAVIITAKGTSKTPIAMGMALFGLVADGEHRAEIVVCARTAEQARAPFKQAVAMRDQSPLLKRAVRTIGGHAPYKLMYKTSEMVRIASNDEGLGQSGHMPSMIIADEYQEHRTSALVEMLEAGPKHRKQPLTIIIANEPPDDLGNPCRERKQQAADVALGTFDNPSLFSFIAGLDKGDDPWTDESCWIKANPSLPTVPGYEFIREQVRNSEGLTGKRSKVGRLHFCIQSATSGQWLDREEWLPCEVGELSPASVRMGKKCYFALDLAIKLDLTAGALIWDMEDGTFEVEVTCWTPDRNVGVMSKKLHTDCEKWVTDGHLTKVGSVQDFSKVAEWIKDAAARWNVVAGCYDPRFIDLLVSALDAADVAAEKAPGCVVSGIPDGTIPILAHPQGTQAPKQGKGAVQICMHTSIEGIEASVRKVTLRAKRNPVLRWAVLGCAVTSDQADNRRFLKKSSHSKIDPAQAMTMGFGLAQAYQRVAVNQNMIILDVYA